MSSVVNHVSFLRTSREFPEEIKGLAFHAGKSYIEIANAVNTRTIGIFPVNRPAVNGENWFISENQKQQGLRQIYTFTGTGSVPHGIDLTRIFSFTKPQGSFTDGTNYYGCIYGSNVAIAGQVSFYLDANNINIIAGAGAPAIVSGLIILEWISEP